MSFRSLSFASLAAVALFAGSFSYVALRSFRIPRPPSYDDKARGLQAMTLFPISPTVNPRGSPKVHDQTRWCNVLLREH